MIIDACMGHWLLFRSDVRKSVNSKLVEIFSSADKLEYVYLRKSLQRDNKMFLSFCQSENTFIIT